MKEARRYAYNYAQIDLTTHMCIGVITTTLNREGEEDMIEIPVYDENYLMKYYIDGNWYEDAAGTIPWQSSLI